MRLQSRFVFALALSVAACAIAVVTSLASAQPTQGTQGREPLPPGTAIETVLSDMDNPVALAFDPNGRLFFTEKNSGRVRLYADGELQPTAVITFAVETTGERGLLGIALDPNFSSNHYIYVYYTCDAKGGCTELENRVVRFAERGGVGFDPVVIFTSQQLGGQHVGGNIHFGPDGKLYITIGDSGWFPQYAQDVTRTQGKMHRINPDGTIPDDNPVFTQTGALPTLYARGLRNSFDFTFDPLAPGRIFASENGPSCDDEMNRIEAGFNYGWRAEYPCDDPAPDPTYNTIAPLWYLQLGSCCSAPTGITVYTGDQIPQWTNDLFMANYNFGQLVHFRLNEDRTEVVSDSVVEGITTNMDIETGPDGAFWYIEGGGYTTGDIKRLVAVKGTPTTQLPTPTQEPTPSACQTGYSDIPPDHDFYRYVMCLTCRSIVSGYPCGGQGEPCSQDDDPYFRPNKEITRGQIAKVVAMSAGYDDDPAPQAYEDVPEGSPYYGAVNSLAARGIMGGYPCGNDPEEPCRPPANLPYFRPHREATRGQIAKIVSNAAGFEDPPTGQTFEDVPQDGTFYTWIERLASRGTMSGYPCGGGVPSGSEPCVPPDNRPYFRWGKNVTRGQAAKIASNTFFPGCEPGW